MLLTLLSDVRYAARTLRRSPGFAAAAILTIALGVGVNTGIFTILNGVLFRALPATDAHELVTISQEIEGVPDRAGGIGGISTAEYRVYSERTRTLAGIMGHSDPTQTTLGGESPQEILGTIVTCDYFDVLQQPPALGRGLTARDCATGADPVVVLSHELWRTALAADPQIVGRTVELNRQLFTVVGIAREDTYSGLGFYRTAYFAPISTQPLLLPSENTYANDSSGWLVLVGRRNASLDQVRAELGVIAAQIDQLESGRLTTVNVERATPLGYIGFLRPAAMAVGGVAMTAFALVLLIACANVANLLLARATARSREIAVRLSLGATRARVVRQLLTESLLISISGGALGSLLALWSFQALIAFALPTLSPVGVPTFFLDASPDVRVLAFTLVLTFGTGVVFGLAPALHSSKPDLHTAIKQDSSGTGSGGGRLQGTLVGAQVALCMVLMIAAGLLLRGLNATQSIDPGFDYENVIVASYDLRGGGYDAAEAAVFQRRLLEEAAALPGVEAAAQAILEPLTVDNEAAPIRLPSQDPSAFRLVALNGVTPGYFDLLGIPIVRGRTFNDAELTDASVPAIVTETTARNYWPDQDPIGQTLLLAVGPNQEVALNVVGVARDAQVTNVGEVAPYYLYLPSSPRSAPLLKLLVKSRTDFATTAAGIRAAVVGLDAGLAVRVSALEANLDYRRTLSGALTALALALGLLALALAAVGIYGVVAYFVGRRTREIGVRMALGAGTSDVLGLVLKRTMRPVVVGAAVGIAAAVSVSRVLSAVLFGVSPFDPIGIGQAALCVLGVALLAAVLPGRRAARTQPTTALRYE
jgi:putative ABC transport system permease protein